MNAKFNEQLFTNEKIDSMIPSVISPDAYARNMALSYLEAKKAVATGNREAFNRSVEKTEGDTYKRHLDIDTDEDFNYGLRHFNSVGQSSKSLIGTMMNRVTARFYKSFFSSYGANILVEQKAPIAPNSTQRPIDVLVKLPSYTLYVSVTTTPRERKKTDWAEEYTTISKSNKGRGIKWGFLGLMYEGSENEVATVQDELDTSVNVVCVADVDSHAKFLRECLSQIK
jgi:hypothetical protein